MFGNLGDIKGLGEGVFEFRDDYGQAFGCIFYSGEKMLLLLVGVDKRTQSKDIKKAKSYLKDWKVMNKKRQLKNK
ncbi:MAG: addiction module killer protein [Bdellovibrionaceae bacterium]|nr:addiction module killer protein [Pseudobdellovibrionaceae bacterium]